jgi:hypothetical protein
MRGAVVALAVTTLVLSGCKHKKADAVPAQKSAQSATPAPKPDAAPIDTSKGHAPAGVRIKVEVLNASKNRGVARKAALYLRDHGYDVVAIGTTRQQQSATVVLDRSNHPEWAKLIAEAIGGEVTSRPDSSKYLDATVLLGSDWTPPPMPFYP